MFFNQTESEKALKFILEEEKSFSESTKEAYYKAFKALQENDDYPDLLDLNNDDPRLLKDRNALKAYCNYIVSETPKESYRRRLITEILEVFGLKASSLEPGKIFELPSQAWAIPTIDMTSVFKSEFKSQETGITILSTGEVVAVKDLKYTVLDDKNVVFRGAPELVELHTATKKNITDLVSYRPLMIALHASLVAVTTGIQLRPENSSERIKMDHDDYLKQTVNNVMQHAMLDIKKLEAELLITRKDFQKEITNIVRLLENKEENEVALNTVNQNLLAEAISCKAIVDFNIRLGKYVSEYDSNNAVIALATDSAYNKLAEKKMDSIIESHINDLVTSGKLERLSIPNPEDRVLFLVAGGQASGKGSAIGDFMDFADANLGGWANCYKGGGDCMRALFLEYSGKEQKDILPELFSQMTQPQASFVSHTKIIGKLSSLAEQKQAPHAFVEQIFVGKDKIELGLKNNGQVLVTIVSTEVKDCLERAFSRGKEIGRFENVRGILSYHQLSTAQLPDRLKENAGNRVSMKIMDNNVARGNPSILIATIDCQNKKIVVHDEEKLLNFIKKTAINHNATSPADVYDQIKLKDISVENYFQNLKSEYIIEYKGKRFIPVVKLDSGSQLAP